MVEKLEVGKKYRWAGPKDMTYHDAWNVAGEMDFIFSGTWEVTRKTQRPQWCLVAFGDKENWNWEPFFEYLEEVGEPQEFQPGDKVWVSDESIEEAEKDSWDDTMSYYYHGMYDGWYVVAPSGNIEGASLWRYCIGEKKAEAPKEMTVAEIEKVLGYPVKIVKEGK